MGKAKKRSLHLGINNTFENVTRQEAISYVVKSCSAKHVDATSKDFITLFGLTCEELLENGAKYEDVMSIKTILQ